MAEEIRTAPERGAIKETGSLLLAIGGLAAAFGAASCCALPLMLGGLGLSSAWLFGIAVVAAPHRLALITAAVVSLAAAGAVLAWHRRAMACAEGAACGNRGVTPLVIVFLTVGAIPAVAGYVYASSSNRC